MALYRTYRPKQFDDVIGQEAVVDSLRKALRNDRVSHALLLKGTRGTGKTTLARIVAKGLNCEQGPTDTPCGTCDPCISIENGSSPDVFEMDAASNRGVEHAEALRARLAVAPMAGRRHIFIIDEAHMLTPAAQNALLVSLEEPPANVHFIFATTAPHKLLDTIRSRCHEYGMQRANAQQLQRAIERVAQAEELKIDGDAVLLIASAANGSFRDALSRLDQFASADQITLEMVERLLGRPADSELADLVDLLADGDGAGALTVVQKLSLGGYDLDACLTALAQYARLVMYAHQMGAVPDTLAASPDLRDRALATAGKLELERIFALLSGVDAARQQSTRGLPLELAFEMACMAALVDPVAAVASVPSPGPAAKPTATPEPKPAAKPAPAPAPPVPSPEPVPAEPQPAAAPAALSVEQAVAAFPAIRLALRTVDSDAYLTLFDARAVVRDGCLEVQTSGPLGDAQHQALAAVLARVGVDSFDVQVQEIPTVFTTVQAQPAADAAPAVPAPEPVFTPEPPADVATPAPTSDDPLDELFISEGAVPLDS